jgi:hypothetical protein
MNELSLEHEARLKPSDESGLRSLLARLTLSNGERAGRLLLPPDSRHAGLTVEPVRRRAGPQSLDIYFDLPGGSFVSSGYTFRQRVLGREFMTWAGGGDDVSALNLELPAVDLQWNGLTARLEFNWLDRPSAALAASARKGSPARLASEIGGLDLQNLTCGFENSTVRQKFLLRRGEQSVFAVNVDFIRARDLRSQKETRFVDIDVSGMNIVDSGEIDSLAALSGDLMVTYSLEFNFETKASRAARALEGR